MENVEYIRGLPFSCMTLDQISKKIIDWGFKKERKTVYCCGMSDVVLADENSDLKKCLQNGDLITADGMPLVFLMRKRRKKIIERGYGPDIFKNVLKLSSSEKIGHFFLGTTNNNLEKLVKKIRNNLGNKNVLEYYSPPFKKEFDENDLDKMANLINNRDINIVWVGMGSDKQIFLADALKKRVNGKVFVTVGAAFDFLTENKKQAPVFIQKMGLEWLFRLISEPKRLFKRYLKVVLFILKNKFN